MPPDPGGIACCDAVSGLDRVRLQLDQVRGAVNAIDPVLLDTSAITSLREHLHHDPRHKGLLALLSGTREERLFGDWSMGFQDLGDADASALPGYSEFLDSELTAEGFGDKPAASQRCC